MGRSKVTQPFTAADKRFFHYVAGFPDGEKACAQIGMPPLSEDVYDREMEAAFEVVTRIHTTPGLTDALIQAGTWWAEYGATTLPMETTEEERTNMAEVMTRLLCGAVGLLERRGLVVRHGE